MVIKKLIPNIIVFVLVGFLAVPQITFATWWNPFTWTIFNKTSELKIEKTTTPIGHKLDNPKTTNQIAEIEKLKKEALKLKKQNTPMGSSPASSVLKVTKQPVTLDQPNVAPTVIPKVVPLVVSPPTNPAIQCLPTKKGWDNFIAAINKLNQERAAAYALFWDSYGITDNQPDQIYAKLSYVYTRLVTGKSKFMSKVAELRKLTDLLPIPPQKIQWSNVDDYQQLKDSYNSAVSDLEDAYEFALQAGRVFAEDKDGFISSNERQIAISLLGDYKKASDKYFNDIKHSQDLVWYFKNELTTRPVAGCAFTFYADNGLVKTTTVDEALFIQGYPKSVAIGNTGGRLYITTKLPIEVNEDGQVKKVLALSCNSQDLPISRIDNNTIGTSISQSGIRRQCVFTYSGNGNNLSSPWLDFNF